MVPGNELGNTARLICIQHFENVRHMAYCGKSRKAGARPSKKYDIFLSPHYIPPRHLPLSCSFNCAYLVINTSKIDGKLCQYSPATATSVAKFHSAMCFICVTVHSTNSFGTFPNECSMMENADVGELERVEKFLRALNLVASMKWAKVSSKMTVMLARSR